MLKNIDLTNKCGSCCHFRAIDETAMGECLRNPYGEDVVRDPKYPCWIVGRSRRKCALYNSRPMTNGDRTRAMTDEELAKIAANHIPLHSWPDAVRDIYFSRRVSKYGAWLKWIQQPVKGDDDVH